MVNATDFQPNPLIIMTTRLVWHDQWNMWAQAVGEELISLSLRNSLEEKQIQFETEIWRRLGGMPKETDVETLPTME